MVDGAIQEPVIITPSTSLFTVGSEISFAAKVTGIFPETYDWRFGADATPEKCGDQCPKGVVYKTDGPKTVELAVTDVTGKKLEGSLNITVDPSDNILISETIRREVCGIRDRGQVIIKWLTISVLFLTGCLFVGSWYGAIQSKNVSITTGMGTAVTAASLIASIVILFVIGYFWRTFIDPDFHVLVIRPEKKQKTSLLTQIFNAGEIECMASESENKGTWPPLFFILASVSLGLAISALAAQINTLLANAKYPNSAFGLLFLASIIIMFLIVLILIILYHFKSKTVQAHVDWLLLIPVCLLLALLVLQIFSNSGTWFNDFIVNKKFTPPAVLAQDIVVISARMAFLTTLLLSFVAIRRLIADFKDFLPGHRGYAFG